MPYHQDPISRARLALSAASRADNLLTRTIYAASARVSVTEAKASVEELERLIAALEAECRREAREAT